MRKRIGVFIVLAACCFRVHKFFKNIGLRISLSFFALTPPLLSSLPAALAVFFAQPA
jgi:hypothetical protein